MRGSKSICVWSHGALPPCFKTPRPSEAATAGQLTFFGRAYGFSAAVTLGEFFNATGGIDKFLFASEKRMTSRADTDSNVAPGRAGLINRAARAHDIGFVIFWVNVCFHRQK